MVILLEVGESAGAECKAVLQEITALVDRKLEEEGQQVKNLFGAAKVHFIIMFDLWFMKPLMTICLRYSQLTSKRSLAQKNSCLHRLLQVQT